MTGDAKSHPKKQKKKTLLRFSPERIVKVGIESLVLAIATEERHNVFPREAAAASESKYCCELFGKREHRMKEQRNL